MRTLKAYLSLELTAQWLQKLTLCTVIYLSPSTGIIRWWHLWSIYKSRLEFMLQNELLAGSPTWNVLLRASATHVCYLWDTAVLLHHISLTCCFLSQVMSFLHLSATWENRRCLDIMFVTSKRKEGELHIYPDAIHLSKIQIQICCIPANEPTHLLCRWVIYNDHKVCLSERPPKDLGYIYFYHRLSSS